MFIPVEIKPNLKINSFLGIFYLWESAKNKCFPIIIQPKRPSQIKPWFYYYRYCHDRQIVNVKKRLKMNKMNWTDERFRNEILDYKYLIENFKTVDVTDRDFFDNSGRNFQRICNDYFHNALIARKYADTNILQKHYELLESYKDLPNTPDFESALRNLFKETDIVVPLLASQVAHFFNPDLPIYQSSVFDGLNLTDTAKGIKDPESKIQEACKVYKNLTDTIHEFRDSDTGKEIIAGFKSVFNQYPRIIQNITDTKIIDFYFWLPTLDEEK